jgi:hypothetical protein
MSDNRFTAPLEQPEIDPVDRENWTFAERERILKTLGSKRVSAAVCKVYGHQLMNLREAIQAGKWKEVLAELRTDLRFMSEQKQ